MSEKPHKKQHEQSGGIDHTRHARILRYFLLAAETRDELEMARDIIRGEIEGGMDWTTEKHEIDLAKNVFETRKQQMREEGIW